MKDMQVMGDLVAKSKNGSGVRVMIGHIFENWIHFFQWSKWLPIGKRAIFSVMNQDRVRIVVSKYNLADKD